MTFRITYTLSSVKDGFTRAWTEDAKPGNVHLSDVFSKLDADMLESLELGQCDDWQLGWCFWDGENWVSDCQPARGVWEYVQQEQETRAAKAWLKHSAEQMGLGKRFWIL